MVKVLARPSMVHGMGTRQRRTPLGNDSGRAGMYLINGELTDELQDRYNKRENEVARLLFNMEEAFTAKELARPEAQAIMTWLNLRDVYHTEPSRYRANPGEPIEAYEERIRICRELTDMFPNYRVGHCANIWLWLMLGGNGRITSVGKRITSNTD